MSIRNLLKKGVCVGTINILVLDDTSQRQRRHLDRGIRSNDSFTYLIIYSDPGRARYLRGGQCKYASPAKKLRKHGKSHPTIFRTAHARYVTMTSPHSKFRIKAPSVYTNSTFSIRLSKGPYMQICANQTLHKR